MFVRRHSVLLAAGILACGGSDAGGGPSTDDVGSDGASSDTGSPVADTSSGDAVVDSVTPGDSVTPIDTSTTSDATSDAALGPYPAGPYGSKEGDVIANLSWMGYENDAADVVSNTKPYAPYSMDAVRRSGRSYALVHVSDFY
jgi:hypothetical protein